MAKMPKGAGLILNPSSSAPGFFIKNVYRFAWCSNYIEIHDASFGTANCRWSKKVKREYKN